MNRRRIFNWALIVVGVTLLAWLVWLALSFFFGGKDLSKPSSWVPSTFFPASGPGIQPVDTTSTTTVSNRRVVPKLRQLSNVPTSGSVSFEKVSGGIGLRTAVTMFRWIERASGHIYETRSDDTTKTRISNTTIPGIQEAFFSDDGQSVVARYLRDDNQTVETLVGKIEATTGTSDNGYVYNETKLVTRFLEPNILAAGDSPEPGYFYTLTSRNGGSAVTLLPYITGTSTTIFESPLSQWVVSWASSTLTLRTKADSEHAGYLFEADTETGETEKLIEARVGLTSIVNPAGTKALFSETSGGNILLWVKDFSSGTERLLELKTLPEKCAWSPTEEDVVYCGAPDFYVRGAYPTNWYQGRFSFDDNIWRIETTQERYVLLVDTRENEDTFDVWKPQVSPNGKFFTFFNKRDLTLWSLDVSSEDVAPAPEGSGAGATVATGTPAA